jgi:DNA-binding IclR family transcriptional regulator
LRRELSIIRRVTGVAVCRGEFDAGASGLGVAVVGAGGRAVAALEMEVTGSYDLPRVRAPLVVAARSLSRDVGTAPGRVSLMPGPRRPDPARPVGELRPFPTCQRC